MPAFRRQHTACAHLSRRRHKKSPAAGPRAGAPKGEARPFGGVGGGGGGTGPPGKGRGQGKGTYRLLEYAAILRDKIIKLRGEG